MASLPSTKRYYAEDYQEAPPWFPRFLSQINLFTEPMFNILNAGVDVTANTNEEIYIFTIPDASATATDNTFLFTPKKFVGAPNGVIIGQCTMSASVPTANIGPVVLDWVYTGSQINILAIHNLDAGKDYTITVRIF